MRRPEVGILALAMLASACTVPTEMPNWDVQWNLPVNVNGLGIDITKLPLPTGITIDSTGSPATRTGFTVQANVTAITRTLGVQCPTCPTATAPKPAFTAPPATTTVNLASGTNLKTATLAAGSQIVVQIQNNFTFDPINPPGGGTPGTITLSINNGATTLGTLTLQGPTQTIPAGQTKSFTVALAGTINTASPITVNMTMDSPAGAPGSPVAMNPNQTFIATPTATLKVSTASVAIGASAISPSSSSMDLSDLSDAGLRIDNVSTNQGAMLLTVNNPFSLGAAATLTFTGTRQIDGCQGSNCTRPMTPVTKSVTLPAGGGASTTSTVTVTFTGTELREMLGSSMTATFSGNAVAGTTTVTPSMGITSTARLRLRVFMKEVK